MWRKVAICNLLALMFGTSANAHQPVIDMAPRWKDGFGLQIRYERYGSSDLRQGTDTLPNPYGLERFVEKTWLEGVYTFTRSARITFKMPYVSQHRVKHVVGVPVREEAEGIGDLIIGVPLKRYRNKGATTSNLGITPSLRLPTGSTGGPFPVSDGSLDVGLSLAYARSTPTFYQFYDLFYWHNRKGAHGMEESDEVGLDINWGWHPLHDNATNIGLFVMWDISARHNGRPSAATLTSASGIEIVGQQFARQVCAKRIIHIV